MAAAVNGASAVVPRDDWFDRLARRTAQRGSSSTLRKDISRRDAVGVFAGSTALAFFGSLLKPGRASAAAPPPAQDGECSGTRTFYREGCKKPVPKKNFKPNENGCGPQNGINLVPQTPLYMTSFTPACNEHDRGYATCNRPKATTDQRFLNDMKVLCLNAYPVTGMYSAMSLVQCTINAEVYYKAVSDLGEEPYKEGQQESCDCCEECPGDQPKCNGECCRRGFVCGAKGLCCEDCQENWKKCDMDEGRCGWGCCMPDLSKCCPGMQAGKIRCCSPNGKCYKGGCG